jgi:hypothetical protein
MIEHTHDKRFLASQYGKFVIFMERPPRTRQKRYTASRSRCKTKWFKTTAQARVAKEQWMGKLV